MPSEVEFNLPDQQTEPAPVSLFRNWVAAPSLLLGVCSVLVTTTRLDLLTAGEFYDFSQCQWPLKKFWLCELVKDFGPLPGVIVCVLGLMLLGRGFCQRHVDKHVRLGMFLVLSFLLGPGLIVNVALKNNFGRPRPHEVLEFSGRFCFAGLGIPGSAGTNSSFPSGHAAAAFFVAIAGMGLLILGRKRSGVAVTILGLVFGLGVGAARMAQGAHFLSDILWSAGIVYLSAVIIADCTRIAEFGPAGRPLIPRRYVLNTLDRAFVTAFTWRPEHENKTQSSPIDAAAGAPIPQLARSGP